MPAVALAALDELAEQPERIRRGDLLGPRHLQQQPLAQAERAHRQRSRPYPVQQLGRDRQAGQDDIGALGAQARHLAALLRRPAREPVDELLHLGRRDVHAVHAVAHRLAPPRLDHAPQAGEGPAGSDHHGRRPRACRDAAPELLAHVGPEALDLLVRAPLAREVQLGETDRAERQGHRQLDQPVHGADQLEAAAADVGDQRALPGQAEVVGDRAVGERRLGLGIDDPERNVELLAHPPDEPGAVLRFADGRGGDGGDALHPAPLADLAHAGQGLHGALDGGLVQAAGPGESRREAGLVLELVDDLEAGGGIVLRHEQADGVGADVDGRDAIAGGRLGAGPGRRPRAHEPEVAWYTPEAGASPRSSA